MIEAAFAHPEGKRVASFTWTCHAPSSTLGTQNLTTGVQKTFDARCGSDRLSRLRLAGPLVDAVPIDGSNTGAAGTEAYLALVEGLAPRLGDPVTKEPPSLVGREVLHVVRAGEEPWRVWQNDAFVAPEWMAGSAGEVGLVALSATTWEAEPSRALGCGVSGHEGSVTLTLVAVPENVVVSRTNPPCELPSEERACAIAGLMPVRRCGPDPAAVRAFLASATGRSRASRARRVGDATRSRPAGGERPKSSGRELRSSTA